MHRYCQLIAIAWSLILGWQQALGQNRASFGEPVRPEVGEPPRPNILFLFADDQRCDTIGAYGNDRIQTPNLDRLARGGLNLRNAYCFGSPHGAVCIPSRAMLHSGRTLFHLKNLELDGHETLGELLGRGGYQTFATGKWHNGKPSFVRSFQSGRNIMMGGMSNHAEVPIVQLDPTTGKFSQPKTGANFSSKLFADAAIEFLKE